MFFLDPALYWPLKLAQISLTKTLGLHFAAASLQSYALFIFGGGVREESYSRSSLNKSGNSLFLGGTFQFLALAAGVGWGQMGWRGRAGNGADPTFWSDRWPGSQEPPVTTSALHVGMLSAHHPLIPSVVCDPSSYSSLFLWRLLTGSTLNQKEEEEWVE